MLHLVCNIVGKFISLQEIAFACKNWWKLESFFDEHLPKVCMAGLDPSRNYIIKELNRIDNKPLPYEGKAFSGKFLMETGLEIPYTHNVDKADRNDWSSRVLYLVSE